MKLRATQGSPDLDKFLISTMDASERVKAASQGQDADRQRMEDLAISVFGKVDNEDRAGQITEATSNSFFVASTFFDVLVQFHGGTLPPDIEEKRKYARFKAAYIRKCFKTGEAPLPGPPGENLEKASAAASADAPAAPAAPAPAAVPAAPAGLA